MIFETLWGMILTLPLWFILPRGMEAGLDGAVTAVATETEPSCDITTRSVLV